LANNKWIRMEIDVRLAGIGRPDPRGGMFDRDAAEEMVRQFEKSAGTLYGQFADRDGDLGPTPVSLSSVTHVVKSVWMTDNLLWATVRVLDTPMGNSLMRLIEAGFAMDFFPRVVGSQRADGTVDVQRFLGVDVAPRDVQGRRQDRIGLVMGAVGQR
jgi:hypothetical protein